MRYCEIKRSSPLLFYLLHWIEGTRWNKGFSMIFLLPWWHRCHRMEAFKGILWRYIPTKTIQKGDVSHICPPIPIVAWSMIRFATQLMGYHSQAMRMKATMNTKESGSLSDALPSLHYLGDFWLQLQSLNLWMESNGFNFSARMRAPYSQWSKPW